MKMSECTHDCASCSANCASREKESLLIPANALSDVKHVIGVVSGKGGVGKSLVTTMLAVLLQREGYKVGILDADVTGPSIPKAFGMKNVEVFGDDNGMIPPSTTTGIDVMSVNLLLSDETKPVVWRGSIISGTVQQFWKDTIWDVDVLLVDCPPGTGDVPLTVFQTLPLDGIVIVSSPQDLVSMIVSKAANMAAMMNIPVLGLVENLSYVKCPDCGKEIKVLGESHIEEIAEKFGYELLARIPMDPKLSALVDRGMIELMENDYMDNAAQKLIEKLQLTPEA
jgi:Mrp family chromosome partitioning ATPase